MLDQQLAKVLKKTIIRQFHKQNVHSWFIDKIWSCDFAIYYMILIFSVNRHGAFL